MKLYGYTTVFRYVYENESIENFYYFCSDEYMPSDKEVDEIKEDLEIGDNDIFELFGHTANDFNGDNYLSDRLISALTVEDTPKEYVDLQLAYITTQYINREDKIGIIKSLIELYQQKCNFKQFRKMYKVNLYALNKLLHILDENEEIKSTRRDFVVKQLRHILGYNNDEVLLKLVAPKHLKARSCAISMDENHVLVGTLTKRKDGFIKFVEEEYAVEKELLKGKPDITPQKEQAYKLYKEGNSYRKISKMTGVSDKTVKSWVDDYMAYYNAKVDNSLEKK